MAVLALVATIGVGFFLWFAVLRWVLGHEPSGDEAGNALWVLASALTLAYFGLHLVGVGRHIDRDVDWIVDRLFGSF